jgi:transcriptional regulator with XRE-family HTH domain
MAERSAGTDTRDDHIDPQYAAETATKSTFDLPATVGSNLRRLRARQGLSLEKLANLSGVSRGMIGQVETGKSTPTVGLLSRLAEALGVELVSLLLAQQAPTTKVLRRARAKTIQASNGRFVARALSRRETPDIEFLEIAIARSHFEEGERRSPGTRAHIAVASGIVVVTIAGEPSTTLAAGDAIIFAADAVHGFHNVGDEEAILYVVLSQGIAA